MRKEKKTAGSGCLILLMMLLHAVPCRVQGAIFSFAATDENDVFHLVPGEMGSVHERWYYETSPPQGVRAAVGWDLISNPQTPIDGPWGEKTGLEVPAPYGDYGVARRSEQPSSYIQIVGRELGICLDVQPDEIGDQTYHPNAKFIYTFPADYYPGHQGEKIPLYPFHSAYGANPSLQFSFEAAIKTSYGDFVRHAHKQYLFRDETSGQPVYVQFYINDPRSTPDWASGYDDKIGQLWVLQRFGRSTGWHTVMPGSATFSDTTWEEYRFFAGGQSWDEFDAMIQALNAKHSAANYGRDRDKWRLIQVSLDLEMPFGYAGSIAGKFRNMAVWTHCE